MAEAVSAGRIEVIFNSSVKSFKKNSATLSISENDQTLEREIGAEHAFVLIGAELPVKFLKSIGIKLENEWEGNFPRAVLLGLTTLLGLWFAGGQTGLVPEVFHTITAWSGGFLAIVSIGSLIMFGRAGDKWSWLSISFLIWYTIYGAKTGTGSEFWPYHNWGYDALSFADRPWSFWYTVMYTGLMTIFGIQALQRWGLERKDRFRFGGTSV